MPFRDIERSLRDILDAIGAVEQFTSGMDITGFSEDTKTIAAVERKLQIISEAAVRLGAEAETRVPGPRWRDIRGLGNWLRHQYDRLELPVIWKTVTDDLPPLRRFVEGALSAESHPTRDAG